MVAAWELAARGKSVGDAGWSRVIRDWARDDADTRLKIIAATNRPMRVLNVFNPSSEMAAMPHQYID